MAFAEAFPHNYGADNRANAQRRWPDGVKARKVTVWPEPGTTINEGTRRYELSGDDLSELHGRARCPCVVAMEACSSAHLVVALSRCCGLWHGAALPSVSTISGVILAMASARLALGWLHI